MSANTFYDSRPWRRTRREALRLDNYECQICKARHKHRRAEIVHHTYHLDEYPQYGLMVYVRDPLTGEERRNLVSVCRECHETVFHPERMREFVAREPLTREMW